MVDSSLKTRIERLELAVLGSTKPVPALIQILDRSNRRSPEQQFEYDAAVLADRPIITIFRVDARRPGNPPASGADDAKQSQR